MEHGTIKHATDDDAELRAFVTEIAQIGWTANVTRYTGSAGVCLRIGRRIAGGWDPAASALEICRRTVEEAAKSARKHIFPRQL